MAVDVRLAVDSDEKVLDVYRGIFPSSYTLPKSIEKVFDGQRGSPPTQAEAQLAQKVGEVDILLGGPPCQGHSNLNNHTRRDDPRNALYLRMARAAEVLQPSAIIIENVATVTLDTRKVVKKTVRSLDRLGYKIGQGVIDLSKLGVPQTRRRHVILALRPFGVDPQALIEKLDSPVCDHGPRNIRWAIEDLENVEGADVFDTPSNSSDENKSRIDWLFDNDEFDLPNKLRPPCHRTTHTYPAMYGKMRWGSPANTLTTGFGCIGQGRYIHPSKRRVVTPHEAARLQMLPDYVNLRAVMTRKNLSKIIGNAVPPPLSYSLGKLIIPKLKDVRSSSDGKGLLSEAISLHKV